MSELFGGTTKLPMQQLLVIQRLHLNAMSAADRAHTFQRSAYRGEAKAARMLKDELDYEPMRAMLYRSAAWLAYHCRMFGEAQALANEGLSGKPPAEIADELREVLAAAEKGA